MIRPFQAISRVFRFIGQLIGQLIGQFFGRGERIRTSGLYVPNVALYQAKLHPE